MSILKEKGSCKFCKEICCKNCIVDSYCCSKCLIKISKINLSPNKCAHCKKQLIEKDYASNCRFCYKPCCTSCSLIHDKMCPDCSICLNTFSSTPLYKKIETYKNTFGDSYVIPPPINELIIPFIIEKTDSDGFTYGMYIKIYHESKQISFSDYSVFGVYSKISINFSEYTLHIPMKLLMGLYKDFGSKIADIDEIEKGISNIKLE